MAKPNLLLCFDAFGTLFRPRLPVAKQYAAAARQCGLGGFTDEQLELTLKAAIKSELNENPNYGKSTGLGATAWWTKVIRNTFTPLLPVNGALPEDLTPTLLHRFASREGYSAEPDLAASLQKLRHPRHFDQVVIGVITNSDDRVPDILSSLGLNVSPLRYGTELVGRSSQFDPKAKYDVDFHCMSYDVGFEKPDRRIFESAEHMLARVLTRRLGLGTWDEAKAKAGTWRKVYVGDEHAKDVVGSSEAGWDAVLLGDDGGEATTSTPRLDVYPSQPIHELIRKNSVVRVETLKQLAMWLSSA